MTLKQMQCKQNLIIALLITLSLLTTMGCQSIFGNNNNSQTDTPLANEEIVPTPTKPLSTAADTIPSNPEPTTITLTFWASESFSSHTDWITQALEDFETANPNIKINMVFKKDTGPASALKYLQLAKDVAPSILPDVVVLHTDDLPVAWRDNLIQPLDGQLDRTLIQDLLPAAINLATIDQNLAAIPFELDVEHLVYNTTEITNTPKLWTDVLSSNVTYKFFAKGNQGALNDASLIQYLSLNPKLTDDQGNAIIDETALLTLLNYYKTALDKDIISPEILDISQYDELWEQYLENQTGMNHINAHRYLADHRNLTNIKAAPIPSQQGQLITIGHGWAFALVTTDLFRQKPALTFIEFLLQIDRNVSWANRLEVIPARQTAFDLVAADDPYWAFLKEYLNSTTRPPTFLGYDQLSLILQQAVVDVISNEFTPDEAVKTATKALRQ